MVSTQARSGGKASVSPAKPAAPKKTKLGSSSLKLTRIDPRVVLALDSATTKSPALTVMVKLNPRGSQFAQFSVSNETGNQRQKVFRAEVEEIVKRAVAETGKTAKVLSSMPNVGVAKVKAQPSTLRTLLEDGKIVGVQLAAS